MYAFQKVSLSFLEHRLTFNYNTIHSLASQLNFLPPDLSRDLGIRNTVI